MQDLPTIWSGVRPIYETHILVTQEVPKGVPFEAAKDYCRREIKTWLSKFDIPAEDQARCLGDMHFVRGENEISFWLPKWVVSDTRRPFWWVGG